ncbi:MAG: hypothetical protein JW828_05675 [Sedimentisphaerales bacterium]|nr:hypothetical protein [Sedimentisphaerales bacterium]
MWILAQRDPITGMPEGFGGVQWKDVTNIHPLALTAVLVLGIAILVLSRRWAVLPMFILVCFVSSVQKIVVFGMDFNLLRIMVLFAVARLLLRSEWRSFVWKPIDTAVTLWVISSIFIHTMQQGTASAFVNRLGFGFDAFGMYFVFRCLIRDFEDLDRTILGCILVSIPVALAFLVENRTGRNAFSVFGGVPAITIVREGRLRCQGAFSHAILAGCFWASLIPLFAARWWKSGNGKIWAITGLVTCSIIIICCASSTPVFAAICVLVGGAMFFLRRHMRIVRWGIVVTLISLHMVMKASVWHLISRVSAVGGSTGWHRYYLIDRAIAHFGEWWLLGTKSTLHWGQGLFDITNQYILEGVLGGALTLGFFLLVIMLAFGGVGRLWRKTAANPYYLALSWALGVSLFVHCMNFIGVSYFGQIYMIWYLVLAMIGSLTPTSRIMVKKIVPSVPRPAQKNLLRETVR